MFDSGRERPAGPQQRRVVRPPQSDRGQHCGEAGAVDAAPALLRGHPREHPHEPTNQQVARAAGAHHLQLPGNPRRQEDGHHALRRRDRRASSRGIHYTKLLVFHI